MKVVAFGKAVLGMVDALESILGDHIIGGVASVPSGAVNTHKEKRRVRYIEIIGLGMVVNVSYMVHNGSVGF